MGPNGSGRISAAKTRRAGTESRASGEDCESVRCEPVTGVRIRGERVRASYAVPAGLLGMAAPAASRIGPVRADLAGASRIGPVRAGATVPPKKIEKSEFGVLTGCERLGNV